MSSGTRQAWARSKTGVTAGQLGCCALSCGAAPSNACMTCPPGIFGAALTNSAGLCIGLGSWSCSTPGFGGLLKAANPDMSRKQRGGGQKHYTFRQHFMKIPRVRCVPCARHVNVCDALKWEIITLLHSDMCTVEMLLSR
jgi:hypothetical protein